MKWISRFVVAALAVAMCFTATVSAVAQTPTAPGAASAATQAPTPVPGGGIILPPHPEHVQAKAEIETLKKDLKTAKDEAVKAWDTAAKFRGSATERKLLNQAVNAANAKVASLEADLKTAEGKTAAAEAKTAEANDAAAKAQSAFAHCEGLEANVKAECLEQAGESKTEIDKINANKLLDLNLLAGGLTYDGKAAVGGAAVNGGRVRYRLRDGNTSIKYDASVDPVMTAMPATVLTTELAAPPPPTGSSWKRYLGACAVGGVGFGGVRGFDYYNSRTPKQVDGDHALSIMGTAAATGCAGGVVAMAVWDGAVYAFSE